MATDNDILKEAVERYEEAEGAISDIKTDFEQDYRFGRLSEQWPIDIQQTRDAEKRPCLTINRLPPMIRQVVNDGRQNRPQIKVRPVDSASDPQTAEVYAGLIKHIEAVSDADVAYDTALDNACSGGFGFVGVDVDYACDDTFDLDLKIVTKPNPLAITWDHRTEAADSSDWEFAFEVEDMDEDAFKREYPDAEAKATSFADDNNVRSWYPENMVRVARYYLREHVTRTILLLSDGMVVDAEKAEDPEFIAIMQASGIEPVQQRQVRSYKITIRKITGKDILETVTWKGSIIPLVPVWGDVLNIKGERYSRSMIHDAKDAQRNHNYARSAATELVSLAPKSPFIGPAGAFEIGRDKWENANIKSWPFLEYDPAAGPAPQRQQFTGVPAGALSEAASSLDDIKNIVGIHDASLGVPGNEVSGKAIRYRQHEGDTSTFHFIDNQHRALRCVGRILVEQIPNVYGGRQIVRIIGDDGKPQQVALAKKVPPAPGQPPQLPPPPPGFTKVYDITEGKYDIRIEAGPSYTTRREETADLLTDFMKAAPQAAPILGPMVMKLSDAPDGEKISAMLATMMPPAARQIFDGTPMPPPGPPPEVQAQLAAEQAKAQHQAQLDQQKAQHEFQLEQQRSQNKLEIERTQAQADIVTMREKAAAEMQIMRERAELEAELKRQEAQLAAELKMAGAAQAAVATPASIQQ